METAVERAANADGGVKNLFLSDPVIGEWLDQYTNRYIVTGESDDTYSVTIMHNQDGKRWGQQRTLKDIIKHDLITGNYLWTSPEPTHKLCILKNNRDRVEWRPVNRAKKKPWFWTKQKKQQFVRDIRKNLGRSNVRDAGTTTAVSRKYTASSS